MFTHSFRMKLEHSKRFQAKCRVKYNHGELDPLERKYLMTGKQKYRGMRLLLLVSVILLIITAAPNFTARGDGGGWPTSTPSPTIPPPTATTASATAYPSVQLFGLPATSTPPGALLPLTEGQSSLSAQTAATPIPSTGAGSTFSILACWPFVLVFLILLLFGVLWLRNRTADRAYRVFTR